MSDDLRPCPFCGKDAARIDSGLLDGRHGEEWWYQVECQQCCARGPTSSHSAYDTTEAWRKVGALRARAEVAEAKITSLRARLREVAQVLIAEVGAAGPANAEDVARVAVERIQAAEAEVARVAAERDEARAAAGAAAAIAKAAQAEVARLRAELAQARADAEATRVAAARDRDRMRGNVDAWRDRTGATEAEVARLRAEAEHLRALLSEGVEIVDSLSAGYGVWTEAAGRALGGAR